MKKGTSSSVVWIILLILAGIIGVIIFVAITIPDLQNSGESIKSYSNLAEDKSETIRDAGIALSDTGDSVEENKDEAAPS